MIRSNWLYIAVMFAVSYTIRILPLTLIRKPIRNPVSYTHLADAPLHIGGRERLELEHGAAGQQRIIDVKVRVLRRGGDEGDGAVLDALQEALLLLFVEDVYKRQVCASRSTSLPSPSSQAMTPLPRGEAFCIAEFCKK